MTDTIDRLDVLDLDDDVRERPVVTRRPTHPPPPPFLPLSATVRYPLGRVPDVQDAVPVARETVRVPRRWGWRWTSAGPRTREAVRVPWRWPQLTRSRVAAGLLGVFLGGLGLHRLYLGYWRRGLTMLAITVVGGFFTLGLAAIVMGVWGFAEGLLILSVRRGRFSRDARGRPLRG
ncbi:NINE protein [Cellulomonas sp.]|uniref:NINE protein n=1 Tax=Cellulomonas sp. TaxID=40001 RepID=UPI003BAAE92D